MSLNRGEVFGPGNCGGPDCGKERIVVAPGSFADRRDQLLGLRETPLIRRTAFNDLQARWPQLLAVLL
jgi:hypothetical protein